MPRERASSEEHDLSEQGSPPDGELICRQRQAKGHGDDDIGRCKRRIGQWHPTANSDVDLMIDLLLRQPPFGQGVLACNRV